MKRYILPLLFFMSCTTLLVAQEAPIVEFYTSNIVTGNPGDTVCLPIKTRNFTGILSAQMGFRWNAEALQFVEAKLDGYGLTDNTPTNFNFFNAEQGNIQWAWYKDDLQALNLDDDTVLFELCFVLNESSAGGFYSLSFDSELIPPEVVSVDENDDLTLVRANFIPGGIFINNPNSTLALDVSFQFQLDCGSYISYLYTLAQGGQAPYSYTWSGPQSVFSTANAITAPRAGLYFLSVKDQNGDEVTAEILVDFMGNEEGLEKPRVEARVVNPDCGVSNGSIDINDQDLQDYSFFWNTGASTPDLENIPAGTYNLVASSNQNFCTDTLEITLTSQGDIQLDTIQSNISCTGETAMIGVQNTGNSFLYLWNTGETENTITVSDPGTYFLTVTDGSCAQEISFEVVDESNPPNPNSFIIDDDNIACDETSTTIGVTYFGLRPDIQYQWATGETTPKIEVSEIGEYTLEVFGADGCAISFPFEVIVEEPNLLFEQEIAFQGCSSGQTQLSMIPQDGRTYDYVWTTAETTASIQIDQAGTYAVSVTERLSGCTQVFLFDEETIGDPTKGAVSLNVDCGIQSDCYTGTTIDISIEGAVEPVQYTWSDGTSTSAGSTTSLFIYSQQNLDLYIEDAEGCRDTISNILADCQQDRVDVEIKGRQYIVCETDPETGETVSYLYNEVLNTAGVPPYIFYWGNGFVDTSYFRSKQPLDSLPNLFINITDQMGNRFDRQLSEFPAAYACGDESTPVFSARDTIVAPGSNFSYPLFIENHIGVERVIYTIDWDPCLIIVDSISFYNDDGLIATEQLIAEGTHEAFYVREGGSLSNDQLLVAEVHCRANIGVEGVSPFLFSINEVATLASGDTTLLRPRHGSIVVSSGENLVLPGDANLNRFVNHQDLLNIGLAYGFGGPDRREQQVSRPDYAYPWLQSTPQSAVDFRNIDSNGDGVINAADLMAIDQNFEYVPSPGKGQSLEGEIPLSFEVDTLYNGQIQSFPIVLGDDTTPGDGVYGLAFSLQYDPAIISSESIQVAFPDSWLTSGTSPLTYFKVDPDNKLLHIAISRTDQMNASGNGTIATVSLSANTADSSAITSFQIVDTKIIAADETAIPALTASTTVAVQTVTNTAAMHRLSQRVRVYPNPVKDRLYIDVQNLNLISYRLFDTQGRQLKAGNITRPVLDMADLQEGVYLLQLMTDQGLVRKLLVR